MQSVILRYYRINKAFMSQIGIWPYQSKTMRILIPSVIVLIDISYFITELIRMFDTWGNVDIAVECTISAIIICGCFTKLFNLSFKIKEMRHLLSLIEYHWKVFSYTTDVEILQDYAIFGRKVIIIYSIYIYISMTFYLIMPLSPQILDIIMPLNETRPRKFLFEVEYCIDREKYYYPILLHSYIAVVVIISIMVCVDTTYMAYVQHGCSLFAAIGYRLEHISSREYLQKNETSFFGKNKDVAFKNDIYLKETIFCEFIICLQKHQLAIQYANLLETLFSLSTGIQLMCNMVVMSLIGIQVIINLNSTEDFLRYISLSVATFFHLLCMTLPGQRLMDHSIGVFDKASRSQWYTFSLKNRKLLQILLYRSIVPCSLTAGKIYVMSMANYSMVIQSAMSYFMTFSSLSQ